MKAVGIIAEYNPFHNGHKYHLKQAKAITGAEASVAVISGAVTQRGEAALWDKWTRAQMAVENGVDLVLEMPYAFACNSAEEFARGGVSLLNGLGFVTDLVFGCESDPQMVIAAARLSAQYEAEFSAALQEGLQAGLSYPAARSQALMRFCPGEGDKPSWDKPNDILAVEYVRQLVLQGSDIAPQGVRRRGSYHDQEISEEKRGQAFSSASAVRLAWREKRLDQVEKAVPPETMAVLRELSAKEKRSLDGLLLYRLLQLEPGGLREIYGCGEGLEYRLWNALPKAGSEEELLRLSASGRYPTARLRRLCMHALTGMSRSDFAILKKAAMEGRLYIRVLACNQKGAELLRGIKYKIKMPVYTNLNRQLSLEEKRLVRGETSISGEFPDPMTLSLKLDIRAADIMRIGEGAALYDGSDFVKTPYISHKNEKTVKSP